jgi:putative two-component system response regulator
VTSYPVAPARLASAAKPPAGKILIVDDEPVNLDVLSRLMATGGYAVVTASNGADALEAAAREHPDVVLLDVNMPGLDGFEVCRRLKAAPATRLTPVVLVTGLAALADRLRGIDSGADDFLTKPFEPLELHARVRSLARLKHYTDELESAEAVIMGLATTIEARDGCTAGHCQRIGQFAAMLGRRIGLDEHQCTALYRGGFLHDVGKIGVPDAVLLKPGPLTPAEYALMQAHTVIGDRLCGELRSLREVRPIIRHHHERFDGSGYPDGLKGNDIPLLAAIVAVVDAYDAITTERPYRRPRPPQTACDELRDEVARGWKDRALVEPFISLVEEGSLGE